MSRRAPRWLSTRPGHVYTLHFHPPFGDPEIQVSKHYTGWAHRGRLAERLTDHALGRGARLTQLQRAAGGTWVVASVEDGTQDRETQLKERGATRRCEVCKAVRDLEAGKISADEALARAGWDRANQVQRNTLLEIFGLPKPPGTAPAAPGALPAPFRPLPEPRPLPPDPELDAVVDALIAGWRSQKTPTRPQPQPEPQAHAQVQPEPQAQQEPEAAVAELERGWLIPQPAARPPPEPELEAGL